MDNSIIDKYSSGRMKLFCKMPKGVIIKSIAAHEETQQIIACTNKGVWTIDKAGNSKEVIAGPLPKNTTLTFTGMEFYHG